jgi:hypothetical protein
MDGQKMKRMRFNTKDPLGGLEESNINYARDLVRKNNVFHLNYIPDLGTADNQYVFKKLMKLSAEDMWECKAEFDPRYMRKRPKNINS